MPTPAAAVEPDLLRQLPQLVEHLRAYDFSLSVEDQLRLATLAEEIELRGGAIGDVESLEHVVAPLVCRNPDDQERLLPILKRWQNIGPGQEEAAPGGDREGEGEPGDRDSQRTFWLAVVVVVALLGALAGAALFGGGGTAGKTNTGPTPRPTTVQAPRSGDEPWAWKLVALIPLGVAGGIYLRRRRTGSISRGEVPRDAGSRALKIDVARSPLFRPGAIQTALHDLRRHQQVPSNDLDVPRTVAATVRNGGFAQFVFGRRNVLPEHLLLTDRTSAADHFGELGEVLVTRLRAEQVRALRGEYFGDPRQILLIETDGRRRHHELSQLAVEQPDLRLLLFADVADFWDPARAQWRHWVALIEQFQSPAVLTPIPRAQWGEREHALANKGFLIVPATSGGLASLSRQLREGSSAERLGRGAGGTDSLDTLIGSEPYRWSDDVPPPPERIAALIAGLEETLDHSGFLYLAAIAVFPTINPRLTEQVGTLLAGSDGAPVLTEERYAALARLPWLRQGRIPDWLRGALIEALSPDEAARVRALWVALIAKDPVSTEQGVSIDIVGSAPERAALRRLLRRLRADRESEFAERILLAFLADRKLPDLAVEAPSRLSVSRWLPRPDWRDGFIALAALAAAAAWFRWSDEALRVIRAALDWAGSWAGSGWPLLLVPLALVGIASEYLSSEWRFRQFHFWVKFPLVGVAARLSRMAMPIAGEANHRLDLLFQLYRRHISGPILRSDFARARQYLLAAGDAGAQPLWRASLIAAVPLVLAELSALAYLLALLSPPIERQQLAAVALSVLFAVLFMINGLRAGRQIRRSRAVRAALRAVGPRPVSDGGVSTDLFTPVSLAGEQQERIWPGSGRQQRLLNRTLRSPNDMGSYFQPVLIIAATLAVAGVQLVSGMISDGIVSVAGIDPPSGNRFFSPVESNWLFVALFLAAQAAAIRTGFKYGFLGRESAHAYRLTQGLSSYDPIREAYLAKVRKADEGLDLLSTAIRRRYPSIEPDGTGFRERARQQLPAAAGEPSAVRPDTPSYGVPSERLRAGLQSAMARAFGALGSPIGALGLAPIAFFPSVAILIGVVDLPTPVATLAKSLSLGLGLVTLLAAMMARERLSRTSRRLRAAAAVLLIATGAITVTLYSNFYSGHVVRLVADGGSPTDHVIPLDPSPQLLAIAESYDGYADALMASPRQTELAALMARESGSSLAIMLLLLLLAQLLNATGMLAVAAIVLVRADEREEGRERGGKRKKRVRSTGSSSSSSSSSDYFESGLYGKTRPGLAAHHLVMLGLGAVIGTGVLYIYSPMAQRAGPALVLSLIVAGVLSLCIAACYADLSERMPSSGSVYTFARAAFGDRVGVLAGWCVMGQFAVTVAAVAVGWSGYIAGNFFQANPDGTQYWWAVAPDSGGLVNLPAAALCLLAALLFLPGPRPALLLNAALVAVKVTLLVGVVVLALPNVRLENFQPFLPRGIVDEGWFGAGMLGAAFMVFYMFTGYEVVANAAEEAREPERTVPFALRSAAGISFALFFLVGVAVVGVLGAQPAMLPDELPALSGSVELSRICADPAFAQSTACSPDVVGAVLQALGREDLVRPLQLVMFVALPTLAITITFALGRLMWAMARERIRWRRATPTGWTLVAGILTALLAGFAPIGSLSDASNGLMLFPILIVALASLAMGTRARQTDRPARRAATLMNGPLVLLGVSILASLLPDQTWVYFAIWLGLGAGLHSILALRSRDLRSETPA